MGGLKHAALIHQVIALLCHVCLFNWSGTSYMQYLFNAGLLMKGRGYLKVNVNEDYVNKEPNI